MRAAGSNARVTALRRIGDGNNRQRFISVRINLVVLRQVEEVILAILGHGAGIIDDKLLKDKTPESFDRVFGTKVRSAATFTKVLDPEKLKFLSLFASIASRYGNRGQSDYAAANDVLCKLASELDRRWSGRSFAVAWGPWSGLGMVSDLEKHLAARGIALIDKRVGSRMFVDELVHGRKGESEVIIAGGAENLVTPSQNQIADQTVAANS